VGGKRGRPRTLCLHRADGSCAYLVEQRLELINRLSFARTVELYDESDEIDAQYRTCMVWPTYEPLRRIYHGMLEEMRRRRGLPPSIH
jgi:hypothetical protein